MTSIEQAIRQEKPFVNEARKALVNLIFTANYVSEQMDRFFADFGLTHKQYNVLRIVKGAKTSPSTAYIRDRMLDKNCDASRIVDRLIQKDVLFKRKQREDKRQIEIRLTQKGFELLEAISDQLTELDSIFGSISSEEATLLNNILDNIRIKPFKN